MTTSPSSGLSPEAKEFIPYAQNSARTSIPKSTIENRMSSIYPSNRSRYPLMKNNTRQSYTEFERHISASQPFHIDSCPTILPQSSLSTQIVLVPTSNPSAGFYPAPLFFSSNDPPSNFYPLEPPPMNYSLPPSKHARIPSQPTRHTHSSSAKQIPPISTRNSARQYQFRTEDFPTLPITENLAPAPSISTNTKSMTSWNTVVATQRPQSTSPHSSNRDHSDGNNEKSWKPKVAAKQSNSSTPERSQSLASIDRSTEGSIQMTKHEDVASSKQDERRKKKAKNKNKKEQEPLPPSQPEAISFTLDDENAFPALGQQIPKATLKNLQSHPSNKLAVSTPGLIPISHVKAHQTYQIRLTEMFNALSTSTTTKPANNQQKPRRNSPINSANPLDSKPAPKRGKEREQPKSRKPTKLKRIINKELEENKKQRQQLLNNANNTIKQPDEKDSPSETDTNTVIALDDCTDDTAAIVEMTESTSTSSTEESNHETDDDDDEELNHQPTSQSQTPFAQELPSSHIKQQIHDRTFREYCSQLIDRQLDELCIQLLLTLKRFQDRKKQQLQSNPERARRKRRFVHGIREVTKHLRSQRLICVLLAPDCQSIQSQGGLNDVIEQIINLCKQQNIPYIFTLNRQKLGRCLNKISQISAIGIFDCSGADQMYKQILDIANENQRAYKQILDNIIHHEDTVPLATPSHGLNSREFYKILHRTFQQQQQQQQQHPQQRHQVINTIPTESLSKMLPKVPAHYAHSRQTSDTSTIYIDHQLINSINAVKKQHTRASSGTFDLGKSSSINKKKHQRTLSDGATNIDMTSAVPTNKQYPSKTHSRTPSGCSAISQIDQQDYFEQSKTMLMINNHDETPAETEESRLKSIHEDTEEIAANSRRKTIEKWINDN